jgi:hypothetical protein
VVSWIATRSILGTWQLVFTAKRIAVIVTFKNKLGCSLNARMMPAATHRQVVHNGKARQSYNNQPHQESPSIHNQYHRTLPNPSQAWHLAKSQ